MQHPTNKLISSWSEWLVFSFVIFLTACGGGGGGGGGDDGGGGENSRNPTDTNLNFKLFPDNYFVNYNVSANLTGSDNKGNTYSGSSAERTLAETIFLGENAAPIETEINFTASNGAFAAVTQTQFFGTNASDRRFFGVDGDTVTVSANTTTIPITATIGDTGTAGTYTDNSGSFSTVTWSIEDGFNGNAKLIFLTRTNNQSGILDNTFTTTYLIMPDGTRLSVELKTFNVNVDLEVTLAGDY